MKLEVLAELAFAMAVATSSFAAGLFAGTGVALALLIYSLSGAAALVAGALGIAYLIR